MREVKSGDMLVHFAGSQKFGDKTKLIGKWLDGQEGPSGERELPLSATNYEEEIKTFWERHEDARKALDKARASLSKSKGKMDDAEAEELGHQIEALEDVVGGYFYKKEAMKDGIADLDKAREAAEKSKTKSKTVTETVKEKGEES